MNATSYSPSYRNQDGTPLRMVPTPLAQGGEGSIHCVENNQNTLVKIYHPGEPAATLARARKLTAMMQAGPELRQHPRLAWPQSLVLNPRGEIAGYRMRRMQGISLVPLTAPIMFRRDLPHWTQRHVVRVTHDLAALFGFLEDRQIYPGDINLNNFLTRPEDATASLIDCDSYQIGNHPSRVLTPDFSAPEVLAQRGQLKLLGPDQLRFSAALLFFYLLTRGTHPFQVRGGDSPEQNILAGRTFMGSRGQATGSIPPSLYARYRALPPRIAGQFKRAFCSHTEHPELRPSFSTWVSAFREYYCGLSNGAISCS